MKYKASLGLSLALTILAAAGLLAFPAQASEGARAGLSLCGRVIVPSLFPFAALSRIMLELRLPDRLGRVFGPAAKKLFGISGRGCTAFLLGLLGGYPLGAATAAELYSSGQIEKDEADTLLGFCDNSGPAFIISAVGTAVFASPVLGFWLYGIHILSAVLTGAIMRGKVSACVTASQNTSPARFSKAFTNGVKGAAAASVTVCGFVVFFSVLTSLLDASGLFPLLCGETASRLGWELHFSRSFFSGFLELGSGIGAMEGLAPTAANLTLASFILGWGGLSVQAQAAACILDCGLNAKRHLLGKLLHGILAAALTFILAEYKILGG